MRRASSLPRYVWARDACLERRNLFSNIQNTHVYEIRIFENSLASDLVFVARLPSTYDLGFLVSSFAGSKRRDSLT